MGDGGLFRVPVEELLDNSVVCQPIWQAMTTPSQRLATILLGEPVEQWISTRRDGGASWRTIATELESATDGQVTVSYEAIRGWAQEPAA